MGREVYRRRRGVVRLWVLLLAANLYGALRLPGLLLGGSGAISHGRSERVANLLNRDFHSPLAHLAVVALESRRYTVSDAVYRRWLVAACGDVGRLAFVGQTASYLDHPDPRLRSVHGHETMILVGLRASLRALCRRVRREDPSAQLAVLVDATVIRILLVPAFMRLAGRWNRVPGVRVHHEVPELR